MNSTNKLILVGTLARAPEVSVSDGVKQAILTVATSRALNGGAEAQPEYHTLVCTGRLAELMEEYCTAGERVYVEGRLEYETTPCCASCTQAVPRAIVRVREAVHLGRPPQPDVEEAVPAEDA